MSFFVHNTDLFPAQAGWNKDHNRHPIKLLIADLDNTGWDETTAFVATTNAFYETLSQTYAGLGKKELFAAMREIHVKYGSMWQGDRIVIENSYIQYFFGTHDAEQLLRDCSDALAAADAAYTQYAKLIPGVRETYAELRTQGVQIVIYTETHLAAAHDRLRRLGLLDMVDAVYAPPSAGMVCDHNDVVAIIPHEIRDGVPLFIINRHHPKSAELTWALIAADNLGKCDAGDVAVLGDNWAYDVILPMRHGCFGAHAHYGEMKLSKGHHVAQMSSWSENVYQERKAKTAELRATGSEPNITLYKPQDLCLAICGPKQNPMLDFNPSQSTFSPFIARDMLKRYPQLAGRDNVIPFAQPTGR